MAKLTGVSVRTLHYYDEINLLKPSYVQEENGYRYYDEKALGRLQKILFYRELDFDLKEILEIISNPSFNQSLALSKQKELLLLKKQRLEGLINLIERINKEEIDMSFNEFDNKDYEKIKNQYAKEAMERWGETSAYNENVEKTSKYSNEKWDKINNDMMNIFKGFSRLFNENEKPSDIKAQEQVGKLRDFITQNHYNCTKEILKGLGLMYAEDKRFKETIDKTGEGTANYVNEAILHYCKK